MTVILYTVACASAGVFAIACLARIVRLARMPIHLRWELYPIPHEDAERAKYGGSRFEEVDWWTKPTPSRFWGELKYMIPEILFLEGLRVCNRKLWLRSFPFHFGLYLLGLTVGLVASCALLSMFAHALMTGPVGIVLRLTYMLTGSAGLVLASAGALGLLAGRLSDPDLKPYTTCGDLFNLLFFIVTFVVLAASFILRPPSSPGMVTATVGLFTWDRSLNIPYLFAAGLLLSSLLTAYIPLTHMSHFIAKYFTYHSVRWDDAPNRGGKKLEARISECLALRPTWAARHVHADGRTWAQIAAPGQALGEKK